jgi:lipoic acid synthetase
LLKKIVLLHQLEKINKMPNAYDKVTAHIKPDWLKIKLPGGESYAEMSRIVERHSLHTICSSGMCPNKAECWSRKTATFMILGDVCTRGCKFCATMTGKPLPIDKDEPERVAESIALMGLKHAVITSVTRDDLQDGGAAHWAAVVRAVRNANPHTTIELLIPDMDADKSLIGIIADSRPDIIGHNIETVERLTPQVRSRAKYRTSLQTIRHIADSGIVAKSGIMVGMGESREEVLQAMDDLRENGCAIITLGQYLRPTMNHWPVAEYVTPQQFDEYKEEALARGFDYVASGPLVRSSYMAEEALGFCKGIKTNAL